MPQGDRANVSAFPGGVLKKRKTKWTLKRLRQNYDLAGFFQVLPAGPILSFYSSCFTGFNNTVKNGSRKECAVFSELIGTLIIDYPYHIPDCLSSQFLL